MSYETLLTEIENGVMTVYDSGRTEIGKKKKVHRQSPTLGAKPPEPAPLSPIRRPAV